MRCLKLAISGCVSSEVLINVSNHGIMNHVVICNLNHMRLGGTFRTTARFLASMWNVVGRH